MSYLLIALIACQSLIAVADNNLPHQFEIQSVELEHKHLYHSNDHKASPKVETNSSAAGHDECHCHMICHLSLSVNQKEIKAIFFKENPTAYQRAYLSKTQAPNLRPPIV